MSKKLNLAGVRFERLVALRVVGKTPSYKIIWECQCDCGRKARVPHSSLISGGTRSCGCLRKRHGKSGTSEYRIWDGIKKRCTRSNHPSFKDYGGRGITVCQRWLNSFEAFYADIGPRPAPHLSVDRIDNDGPYAPWNCRWATPLEQRHNQRPKKPKRNS